VTHETGQITNSQQFVTGPREQWLSLLKQEDVPSAQLLNLKEVFEDPKVNHLGMLVEMAHQKMGKVRLVGSGIRMSETPPQMNLPPPIAGENTEQIFAEMGYRVETVADFKKAGVI